MHKLTLTLVALAALSTQAQADVAVVATVPDLAAIAKEIGGKKVTVTSLSLPSQDPHFVDAKPSLVLKLNKADLLIAVGLDLEVGWLPGLQTQARNSDILSGGSGYLDCSTAVTVRDMATGSVDRSSGDVHPAGNPHYLYDPAQAAACAKAIGAKLVKLDSANAKLYKKGLKKFLAKLKKAKKQWEDKLAAYQGEPIVTYHKSMSYLVAWLGLDEIGTLEPKPGIPPTASHVASLLKAAKAAEVKVVLEESYYPDKTGKLVAEKLGGKVVTISGGADVANGESYIQHMTELVDDLADAFGS